MKPFVVHAHFYQPERTNPWTGMLDPEPSAAPHRDWNERVHAESYRPNAYARIFDDDRRVERIVNTYERLSFDLGPTLLRWLEHHHPDTYTSILDADWHSVARTGHGNALAQAYHHAILPLATERDRRTQIRWGLADFRHRFRRQAEGMWLPETAADTKTLDALVDEGVRFTVLSPRQAYRVRHRDGEWHEVGDALDTGRAYRYLHSDGSGRSLAVLFYDGGLAHWLAFDDEAAKAEQVVSRLTDAADHGLAHAALDGETFGHHRPFGELGLAYALFESAPAAGLEPTNYAEWLAANPPVDEVELHPGEGTSWSCAHGVGRWYRDCGCATDAEPGWNQAWRTPLRDALDTVAALAIDAFEGRGREVLRDPWAARDDYVHLLLEDWSPQRFIEGHCARGLTDRGQSDVWTLLEAQRHAMVMYTSCGWFFGDVTGIETVYVLRSAARVLELLDEVGVDTAPTRRRVVEILGEARSNRPHGGTGADVWHDRVLPEAVSPARIAAQLCLLGLTERNGEVVPGEPVSVAGHTLRISRWQVGRRGRTALLTGRVEVTAEATGRPYELAVVALHLGGLDFHGHVAPDPGEPAFAEATAALWEHFGTTALARLIRLVDGVFQPGAGGTEFDLDWALPWAKQDLVDGIFNDLSERFSAQYARLYQDHERLLGMLVAGGYRLPRPLRAAGELTLTAELEALLAGAEQTGEEPAPPDPKVFAEVRELVRVARAGAYELDLTLLRATLHTAVTAATARAARSLVPDDIDVVERWLTLVEDLGLTLDLSIAQEQAWDAVSKARSGRLGIAESDAVARLGALVGFAPAAWSPRTL